MALLSPRSAATLVGSLLLLGCAIPAPRVAGPRFQPPPVSPPGDMDTAQKIRWWEAKVWKLEASDRADALLQLGRLYVDQNESMEARRCLRQALSGPLTQEATAQAHFAMAKSYLLDERLPRAERELLAARPHLGKIQAQECAVLLDACRGIFGPTEVTLLNRVERFFPQNRRNSDVGNGGLTRAMDLQRPSWGARPARGNFTPMKKPWRLTVHHSAEPLSGAKISDTRREVARIQVTHQDENHWADIGYHFLVDPAGRVIEGRSMQMQGAHAGGNHNLGNVGICLLGNFVPQPERGPDYARAQKPTRSQLLALEQLVDSLRGRYAITRSGVYWHSEFKSTACPGPDLRSWVASYRRG